MLCYTSSVGMDGPTPSFYCIRLQGQTDFSKQQPWPISLGANPESSVTFWDVGPIAFSGTPVSCFPSCRCPWILDTSLFYPSSTRQRYCLICSFIPSAQYAVGQYLLNEKLNCSLVLSYLHKLNQSVHFREVINNAGCRHLLPDLFVIVFETWFQKFIRSLI